MTPRAISRRCSKPCTRSPGVERIRFASPHPRHVPMRLIEAVRDLPKVCKHFHLPVQSGSTRVLAAMRRRYTRESYLELVATLREHGARHRADDRHDRGLPGETDADFDETLSLTRAVRYESMFSFKYSPRPNTLAQKRYPEDVSEAEKTRRIVALQALQRDIQIEMHEAAVGSSVEVLVDSVSRRRDWELSGRTSGNTVVNFPGPREWLGRHGPGAHHAAPGAYSLAGEALQLDSCLCRGLALQTGRHANRNDDQRADGGSGDQHAHHPAARFGRAEGAADLGRHLRSQRHRAADRERQHAAADDARSAEERHRRSERHGPKRSSSPTSRTTRSSRSSTSKSTARRSPSMRVRATRLRWRCARARRSSSRNRSSTTRSRSILAARSPTPSAFRSGSRIWTLTSSESTRCSGATSLGRSV